MSIRLTHLAASAAFLAAAFGFAADASAQQSVMQQCGANWKAAKDAGTVPAGQTWPQFLSQCRANLSTTPAAATTTAAPAAPAAPVAPSAPVAPRPPVVAAPVAHKPPVVAAPAPAPAAPSAAVFPNAISPQYSNLKPGKQRENTCLDQYKANKANNANGGLNWIQKGGGYYSECNKRLKGAV